MSSKRKSTSPPPCGAKRKRVKDEQEPSTSGTSTAPSTPATTTINIDLTATIAKGIAEALKAVAEALKDVKDKPESTTPTTLGNLFKQDMKTGNILPYYPNSYDQKYLVNDTKYLTYIKKSGKKKKDSSQLLYPGRICLIGGNEFPILMNKQPSDDLMAHWKKWLPQFPEPRFKTVDEGVEDEDPIVTVFPMEKIPEEKHAVDPDKHYHVLLKSAIPEVGAPCPEHFTQDNAVFPCMVKVDQSLGGYGNHVAYNTTELADSLKKIKKAFGEEVPYVITKFVENVKETLGCQFYLNKKGEVHWLGTNVNVLKKYTWIGCEVDWDLSEYHRKRVYDSFIMPVAKYLHKKRYFGIVGIDIITSPSGDYLVDINARITGCFPHVLIAREMAREGLTKSSFKKNESHKCSTERLLEKANDINKSDKTEGKILILNSLDDENEHKCNAAVVAFGKTMAEVEDLFKKLA